MMLARMLVSIALLGVLACDTETATMVVVDNDYPPVPDGGDATMEMTVFKVWWVTSLLPDAVAPASEGQSQRTVPNADFAYAVLAPGWDPSSPTPPTRFVAARSAVKLAAARGETLHVHVSDETFVGNCAAGKPLLQDDANFITQRIFPDEFMGLGYDATNCTATPSPSPADARMEDGSHSDGGLAVDARSASEGGDVDAD